MLLKGLLKRKTSILFAGLVLGILVYLGPSIILSLLVLLSIFSFIVSRPQKEKSALTKIVSSALILRLIFFAICIFVVYSSNNIVLLKFPVISKVVGHVGQIVRDFDREIKNGGQIARFLKGEFGNVPVKEISHQGFGFLHAGAWTQGILNFLFGISVFNLLLFPLIDLWAVLIVYYLAKLLFDERVATFASFIYAIMPSIIIISCTNIRFSLSIFSFLLIALFLVRFSETNNFKYLLIVAIGTILFVFFRDKAGAPFLMILPLILLLTLNIRFRTKFTLLMMSTFLFIFLANKNAFIQYKLVEALQNLVNKQVGFITTAQGNIYKIYDEIVYSHNIKEIPPLTLLKMLPKAFPKGFIYFIFAPFPWEVTNVARLYAYPEIIFWYFIVPFALLGMTRGLLLKTKEALPIILLCCYFVVILSLVLGNEGIAMRYRALVAPFFYIFGGSILCKFFSSPKIESHKML